VPGFGSGLTLNLHWDKMRTGLRHLIGKYLQGDLGSGSGRAVIEERYWSLRRQVPVIYLLGFVNMAAMELAASGRVAIGLNLPTFIAACAVLRLSQWFHRGQQVSQELMVRRMKQTVWFAAIVCLAVCARCLYLLQVGDVGSHMAVLLFGGLTAIGVAYGLTALPLAGRIPLLLIIIPISGAALLSKEPQFAGAAFGLVVVAALTMRLLTAHSHHFTDVVMSRALIARERQRVEHAHQEAVLAATTDFLTGLPNRRAFMTALEAAGSGSENSAFAVAILDLDRFKTVNDTFGHAVGDQLLQEVASRLVGAVGARGLIARLGGDEFGLLLSDISEANDALEIGREIVGQVNGVALLNGRQLVVAVCCGLAISRPGENKSPSRIMADADLALYQAKENPLEGTALFEQRMEAPRRRRTAIEQALLSPDVINDFRVVFQPIFDLKTGRAVAHEALARWTDQELGAIPPSEFVPIAEHLNLIDHINQRLMALAFEEARRWPAEVKLAFNLSAIQICSAGSARNVLSALDQARLSPNRLQIEVTETALLGDFERARKNLAELREAGVTIVLDDFGAGYASIGYLRELRFDQIKLDGGLVTAARHSTDGRRLLRAVIGLCENLGVSSIAEHIESEELLKLVVELGCSGGQGNWLWAPVEARELAVQCGLDQSERRREQGRRAA
jgi:diguanylate cyclase (GGDEF)-like protein